jgi:glutamine synthetase type III
MTANNQKSSRALFKTNNILKENKELLLAEKIKFKLQKQLISLFSNLEIEVHFTPCAVESTLIDSTSNLSTIPQEIIFESAKIAEKIAPKTKDIKIYSKLKNCSSQLELSLNEEFAKHSKTFQKIDLINGAKTNEKSRKRIATINVLRRERLSVELKKDLGNQELTRRKLYL